MAGPFLQAEWPAPPGIHAFTTLRHGLGVSAAPFDSFNLGGRGDAADDPRCIDRNRALLAEAAGLPATPHWLRQVHGIEVAHCSGAAGGIEPQADAAISCDASVVLAVLTADCLPVLFCSADGQTIAAAHAGWRGLVAGVLERTVAAFPVAATEVLAWLGPAAGPLAYEVGAEVFAAFVDRDPRAAAAFAATRPGHWLVDLYVLARQRLADAGVSRVFGGGLCTISDPRRFYSHRRDARTGRMASLIWRQPNAG